MYEEARIKKLEKMIQRLSRRQVKKMQAIITPYPISNCVTGEEVTGDILKYIFTCPGIITKGGIFLNEKPKEGAAIVISVENDLGNSAKSFNITRRNLVVEPDIKISTWDRLTVSFHTINPEVDKMTEVWIGFLWIPTIKDVQVKNFLIDELEAEDVSEEGN